MSENLPTPFKCQKMDVKMSKITHAWKCQIILMMLVYQND